jgi:hypothetical protein
VDEEDRLGAQDVSDAISSDSASSSYSSWSSSSSSEHGSAIVDDVEELREQMEPPFDAVAQREAEVESVEREIREARDQRQRITEQHPRTGTFFDRAIGFSHEAGLAVTDRSKCLHCGETIMKGCVRFAYHFSRLRPPRWIHSCCVMSFVNKDPTARKPQAVQRLQFFAERQEYHEDVLAATRAILNELLQSSAASSSIS